MPRCYKYILFACIISFCSHTCVSQVDLKIDSLRSALKDAKNDSVRIEILFAMANEKYMADPDTAFILCERTLAISKSAKNESGIGSSYSFLGYLHMQKGNSTKALEYFQKALLIHEKTGEKDAIATTLNNLGLICYNQGDMSRALEYWHKTLKLREALGDQGAVALVLYNLGGIYKNQDQVSKALEYYKKGLKIQEELGDKSGIAYSLNAIGSIYYSHGEPDCRLAKADCRKSALESAMKYHAKSLELLEALQDKQAIASVLNNMGLIYDERGDQDKALKCFTKSLKISEELGDKPGIAFYFHNIGTIYLEQKKYGAALEYTLRSLQLSQEIGYPATIRNAARQLSNIYKAKGEYTKALDNLQLYVAMRDSITNEENKKASIRSQLRYEYEKRAAADSVKNAEAKKVKDAQLLAQTAQIEQEKFQRYVLLSGLVLVLAGLGFVMTRFRITNRQKKIIEQQKVRVDLAFEKLAEKNKEVLDSIHYAGRIQNALLTSEKYIERKLNSFKET